MAKAGLLFVGTDDGLLLFSNPNNIGRWLRIGQPFRGAVVRAVWALPENPLVVFAAVGDMGLQRSDDGGQTWREALSLEAVALVGHRATAQTFLLGRLGEVYRSDDAGEHWMLCRGGTPSVAEGALAIAYDDARKIYLAAPDGVWASDDAGETWAAFGSAAAGPITALAASPAQPGPLYALAAGGLYACADAASAWAAVDGAPARAAALAALAGKTPALLLALADGGVARSEHGGAPWTSADTPEPVGLLAPAPYHIDTAFAGAGGKLLESTDRGRSWSVVKQDLAPIRSIATARLV